MSNGKDEAETLMEARTQADRLSEKGELETRGGNPDCGNMSPPGDRPELHSPVTPDESESRIIGTVVAVQANYYRVQLDRAVATASTLLCTRRSRLKKIGQQVMVGDRVVIEEPDWEGGRGAVAEVFPRQTELDRPAIANANQVLLVFAIEEPTLDPHQLTRFLVKAESAGLSVLLCLNKIDLVPEQERIEWQERLENWGYQPLFISVETGVGIDAVRDRLKDKITLISGPSGVGKSSLINQLIPFATLRVGDVSGKLGRGRHTTRHVELFDLPSGGLLADSPGFNQPNLDFPPRELAEYFPEARQRLQEGTCQFSDCLHRDEPNCVVSGDWERYDDYLEFLEEAIIYEEILSQQSNPESSMKVKSKGKGTEQNEPKLESKKYRRVSRRFQHQNLEQLYQDFEEEENQEF
ncbi:small ribosomal subunit biogenesis GTPase RsgA [Oscillatoria acuminata]|uniref:Small ribosomal subunit biogenesis GTPase RsgA n=1 Tax=Oscillatoria acuminata PCC 6304 TaxID=56110 RepID=K9TBH9_9CYAN|nr:small ribosomal subunit biogenesis GTPase RsgA [Oscillatoria acuminata]AFY79890.1 ribosome small subunit-dependent GTPase A [Oscillatoria acuminata PCC 6304]